MQMTRFEQIFLPTRKIDELKRKLGQRRGKSARKCRVKRGELPAKHPHRFLIGDDMMHRDKKNVALLLEAHHRGSEQRRPLQVEQLRRIAPRDPFERFFSFFGRCTREID